MAGLSFNDLSDGQREKLRSLLTPERLAYSKLLSYAKAMNPNYVVGRHIRTIAAELEAVSRGEVDRLMIFTPPRHGKTMLISEYFPAWHLGRRPDHQIISSTYSFDRATDIGRKVRNQLLDPLHQSIFPGCQISEDAKAANKFTTQQDGVYVSVGIGGGTTGRGANIFLIDDPIKGREDAESEIAQRRLRDWFTAVAYTRLMPGTSAIILVMTRWSYYDLAGWLLDEKAHENWRIINLPAIAESGDLLGREPGEALWPEKYPVPRLRRIKETLGSRDWSALYQQRPVPESGGMVLDKWFQRYTYRDVRMMTEETRAHSLGHIAMDDGKAALKGFKLIVCSWDTAFKENEVNDPSCCTVWGITQNDDYWLLYMFNKRVGYPDLISAAKRMHERNVEAFRVNRAQVPLLIEDKASGQSLIQDLKKNTNIPVIAIEPDANKIIRLQRVTTFFESGKVFLPERAPWLVDYETALIHFPNWKEDDSVDSTSQFLSWAGEPFLQDDPDMIHWK
ncbi:MAG: phage terminase large subunit [Pseudomonadota bacterium]